MKTLRQLNLKRRDQAAVEAAARLLRERFPVEQVVLFGSKARGTDDAESDIDLLMLTSRELDWQERKALVAAMFDIELAHDVVISTLVVPVREWEEGMSAVLPIHDEIERDGVLI
jgi:uncharacterized protein